MSIGNKIRKLREMKKMTQNELALQLGISQPTLFNIEMDYPQKIDFFLMDKICTIFDKDFSYFANDNLITNNIKENTGQISCENFTVNNNYPQSILIEIQNLINENEFLKAKIAQLEDKK